MLSSQISVLELRNVDLQLKTMEFPILQNIDFTLYEGDIVILLGGNGSGKSSLLKIINQTHSIQALNLHKGAFRIADSSSIITLTQEIEKSLFFDLTVLENCILWDLRVKSVSFQVGVRKESQFFSDYLYSYNAKLPEKLNSAVGTLSGGEKQALLLALCLLHPPKLMLLDEHTSALDPKTADNIMEKTINALKQHQVTSIITTHNLEMALRYGNRLLALNGGKIVFEADGEEKAALKREDLLRYCY